MAPPRCSPLLVAAVLAAVALAVTAAPEVKSMQRTTRFIPSSSRYPFSNLLASRASFLSSGSFMSDVGRPKRALFDDSCKGVYDRELFGKLDRVCEDCYNLYRKPTVSYECRRDCYSNPMFENCLYDLMLHEMVDRYAEMVQVVGKK